LPKYSCSPAQSILGTVLRNGARTGLSGVKKISKVDFGNLRACRGRPAVSRKKEAVSGDSSEQDDSASGFAWVAREPKLMVGAEGRASSQRSIDYHSLPGIRQDYFAARIRFFNAALFGSSGTGLGRFTFSTRSLATELDAKFADWTQGMSLLEPSIQVGSGRLTG
jgi:hypothetical protein